MFALTGTKIKKNRKISWSEVSGFCVGVQENKRERESKRDKKGDKKREMVKE